MENIDKQYAGCVLKIARFSKTFCEFLQLLSFLK